jgi:hypothetical protein
MVDLSRTEPQMLAEIECAPADDRDREAPPTGPWRVVGRTPADVLPTLAKALSGCYAHVPDKHVSYDLIAVIKKGLGNAYKWGNERNREKRLIVTTVMTGIGAVIKIGDQGNGFDVSRVVGDRLFTRKGSGLTRFRKTSSVISYADGGRTLLIRFLCDVEADRSATGTLMTAAGAAQSNVHRIDLRDLSLGDQVKVKGISTADGNLLARKVTVNPFEELAVIEAPLQQESGNRRVIRLLNLNVSLSEPTQIIDAGSMPADVGRLRTGQVVCLTGRYVPGEGFTPIRIKIRPGQKGYMSELRGRIEAIDHAGQTFRAVGITVVTDDGTDVHRRRSRDQELGT